MIIKKNLFENLIIMQQLCEISIFSKQTGSSRQLQYSIYKGARKEVEISTGSLSQPEICTSET